MCSKLELAVKCLRLSGLAIDCVYCGRRYMPQMGTSVLDVSAFENGMGYVEPHLTDTNIWHYNSCTVHVAGNSRSP